MRRADWELPDPVLSVGGGEDSTFQLENQARWVPTVPCGKEAFPSPVDKL